MSQRRSRACALAALFAGLAAPGEPAGAATPPVELPPPVYEIRIEARYDADTFRIQGTEFLRWHNTSDVAVEDLWFHHYLNAFASNRSTFMRESGGRLRGDLFDEQRWGWIEVSSLQLTDGTDLKGVEEYRSPDDGNPHDRTVARYPLPQPLPPGAWIELEIAFESQLPTVFARTGAAGDYVLAGQWFPKIAVFEPAGLRGRKQAGWNCHQFHAHSEFYADFGDYDVTLTLPERYRGKIGATGKLVEEKAEGGEVTVRYVQRGVHDFAWTADPRFLVIEDRFDPQADVPAEQAAKIAGWLGLPPAQLELPPTAITLLLQPEHRPQKDEYLRAVKAALRGLGLRLGPYPYETLTVVDPAEDALGSGGMEYPTFITGGTDVLLNLPFFRRLPVVSSVTVHEFAHQYFQGMIASNEFEESWIDEGITSFYEEEVMEETYAPVSFGGQRVGDLQRLSVVRREFTDPVATPSWGFFDSRSYGVSSYGRPSLMLQQLERLLGPETFHRAMRDFFQQYRFAHPSTADFERAFSRSAGRDLDWFFSQALHSSRTLDYSIRRVEADEVEPPQGIFWLHGERIEETQDEEASEDEEGKTYRSTVVAYREGSFIHPVTVEIRFEDGETLRRDWDGRARWRRWTFTGTTPVVEAVVDPDGVLRLEMNRLDNGRRTEQRHAPVIKLLAQMLFWLQNLAQATALLG